MRYVLDKNGNPVPEQVAACADCGAVPCDCERHVWGVVCRHRRSGELSWDNSSDMTPPREGVSRRVAQNFADGITNAYETGPVQRITDPPYQFDAPPPLPALAAQGLADAPNLTGGEIAGSIAPVLFDGQTVSEMSFPYYEQKAIDRAAEMIRAAREIADAASAYAIGPAPRILAPICALSWCSRPMTGDRLYDGKHRIEACSTLCLDTEIRKRAAEKRLADFKRRGEAAAVANNERQYQGILSEYRWAEQRTADELEALRREHSALRHDAPAEVKP